MIFPPLWAVYFVDAPCSDFCENVKTFQREAEARAYFDDYRRTGVRVALVLYTQSYAEGGY